MMDKQFDVEAFKRFVASRPAHEEYDWSDTRHCALAQFGCPGAVANIGEDAHDNNDTVIPFPIYDAAALTAPHTFGALSERLSRLSTGEG